MGKYWKWYWSIIEIVSGEQKTTKGWSIKNG